MYRFPLPEGAAVDRMRIEVGDRILEGQIQEKDTARRSYQKARDSGRTATLVEQQRRNQFETRLANIGPGEAIKITIGYLQNVTVSRDGILQGRYSNGDWSPDSRHLGFFLGGKLRRIEVATGRLQTIGAAAAPEGDLPLLEPREVRKGGAGEEHGHGEREDQHEQGSAPVMYEIGSPAGSRRSPDGTQRVTPALRVVGGHAPSS